MNSSFAEYSRKRLRNAWIIWTACLAWTFLSVISAFRLTRSNLNFEFADLRSPVVTVLLVTAIFSLCLAYFIPHLILKGAVKRGRNLMPPAFMGFIVRQAFISYVTGVGLAASVQVQHGNVIVIFFVLSLIGFSLNYPRVTTLRLSASEFERKRNESVEEIKAPLTFKIFGFTFIVLGIINAIFANQEFIQNSRNHVHTTIRSGHLSDELFILGIFTIFGYRLKIKNPSRFWIIMSCLVLFCAFSFGSRIVEKRGACRDECNHLVQAKQLKPGMDENACFVEMCSQVH